MAKDPPSDSSSVHPQRAGLLRRVLVAIAWGVGGFIFAVFIAAALFVSLIDVDGVHRYLLDRAQTKATSMLGVPVRLQNFSVDFPALRVDLYGLTIDGAAPYPTPPFLRVSHIAASARIVSIFRREWYLNRVEIDRPVVWIVRGKDGESNLPVLPKATGTSNIDLFSLAIRQATLRHGEVYFNNRPQSLSARLVDLKMNAAYNPPAHAYTGRLAYTDGRIQFGAFPPIVHTLDASFTYTPGELFLKRAIITSGKSNIELTGDVTHFDQPEIRAQYDLTVDGEEMRHFVRRQWLPSGTIHAKGAVTYVRDPAKPPLDTLTLAGSASSRALTMSMRGRSVSIRNLSASYSAAGGEVRLRQFRADVLGGVIAMDGTDKLNGDRQGVYCGLFAEQALKSKPASNWSYRANSAGREYPSATCL